MWRYNAFWRHKNLYNQHQKSEKAPFIIYADLEFLIEKIDGCKNNPKNLYTTKLGEHIPSDFPISTNIII